MTDETINGMLVIAVNKKYRSAAGDLFDHHAAPDMVAKGYFVNRAVLLRKPNGKLVHGNQVLVTPKGMAMLQREVPLNVRNPSCELPQ
jgi:hypothetical protein